MTAPEQPRRQGSHPAPSGPERELTDPNQPGGPTEPPMDEDEDDEQDDGQRSRPREQRA